MLDTPRILGALVVLSATTSILIGAAGASIFAAAGTSPQRAASPFEVGEGFPDIAFPSLSDGTPTRMSDFRGRKVMLHVFASW